MRQVPGIERVDVKAYRIPTEEPESDGTYQWSATTIIVVQIHAGGAKGLGYTYGAPAVVRLVQDQLAGLLQGKNPLDLATCWNLLIASLRNLGEPGIGMLAVSAVDAALWDLKARLLELPLVDLLGSARSAIPVYGSGGFTSYSIEELQAQLSGWVEQGIGRVKMKIGRDAAADPERIRMARQAVGPATELFVDANGGYSRKQAQAMAVALGDLGVTWFEEPVHHLDYESLRLLRDSCPSGMEIAVGEYGFTLDYFHRLLMQEAVDVLQADATRCGITGFLQAANLCAAYRLPLSSHCAPSLHLHLCCSVPQVRHLEYFQDHVRIERLLFDGFQEPVAGELAPDRSRTGTGLSLREDLAHRYQI